MRTLRALIGVTVAMAFACGLDVVDSASINSAQPDGGDAGPTADATDATSDGTGVTIADGALSDDGGSDVDTGPGVCTPVIDDDFANPSAQWDVLGGATYTSGRVDLAMTNNATEPNRGAIWWKAPLTFTVNGHLHVEVDVAISANGVPGAGMTIAWVESNYVLGPTGLGMALCGVGMVGTAVALHTWSNQLSALSSINNNCGTSDGVKTADVVSATTVIVDIYSDRIIGTIPNVPGATMTRVRANQGTGHLGFTATSGSAWNMRHSIDRVRVTSCP